MEWYLPKIPKILHLYYGNINLSFLRYLTIYSFAKYNPDWDIRLYVPKVLTKIENSTVEFIVDIKNYFNELQKIPSVKIVEIDFNSYLGNIDNLSESHKSDYLRWKLLTDIGGVFSDTDILYFRPINCLHLNQIKYKETEIFFVNYAYTKIKPIGFLLSSKDNSFYREIERVSREVLNTNRIKEDDNYQIIGTNVLSRYPHEMFNGKVFKERILCLDQRVVYKYLWFQLENLFIHNKFDEYMKDPVPIGIHWYGGGELSKVFLKTLTKENYKNYNNTVCRLIGWVLDG
jgi:hypothetical protein